MVLAQFCHVVEGIPVVKIEFSTFFVEHGGIAGAFHALYRTVIRSDFVRKVAETFATRILLIGIGLISSVIVARILGPEGLGLYTVAVVIGVIGVQFANLGLHASNTFYVARDRKLLPSLVGNTLVVSFVFGGTGAALTMVIFYMWPELSPIDGPLLILSLLWIPFGLAYMLLQNLLLGIQEVHTYNKIELTNKMLAVSFICLLIMVGAVTVETIYSVSLIALIASFIWILRQLKGHIHCFLTPSFALFKDSLCYGFKAYISDFAALMIQRMDLLMINYYLGIKQAGLYSIAVGLTGMLFLFPIIVGTIAFPKLCAMREWHQRLKYTRKIVRVMVVIIIPLIIIIFFMAEFIITTLYGSNYAASANALVWFLPGFFVWSIEVMYRKLLISIDYPAAIAWGWIGAFCLNIVLNVVLIQHYGIKGAAAASSLTYFVVASVTIFLLSRFSQKSKDGVWI